MFTVQVKKREIKKGVKSFKKGGSEIPGVFYGSKNASTPILINLNAFKKIWKSAGESSAIQITLSDDGSQEVSQKLSTEPIAKKSNAKTQEIHALIHDVQLNPITGVPIHVDFLVIDLEKKIKVKVPLEFTGISEAVKTGLGSLVKVLHEVEIEALPNDLPHALSVDISKIKTLEDNIFVADIILPASVAVITNKNDIVASVVAHKEEKEEAPVDLSKIEVEKKGKKEEEGTEATAKEAK